MRRKWGAKVWRKWGSEDGGQWKGVAEVAGTTEVSELHRKGVGSCKGGRGEMWRK